MSANKEKRDGEYTGRWVARFSYKDITGVSHQVFKRGFKTKRDALEYERDFLLNKSLAVDIPFKNMMVQFLEDKKKRVKAISFKTKYNKSMLRYYDYFNDILITNITPLIVRNWQNEILLKSKLKDNSKKIINGTLITFFNWCVRYRGLQNNPMQKVEPLKLATSRKTLNIITLDDLEILLLDVKDTKKRLLINFLFWTGVRIGEALALTLDDVDLENKIITINKTLQRIERVDTVTAPKTQSSIRTIIMSNKLTEDLKAYINKAIYTMEKGRIFNISRHAFYCYFRRKTEKQLKRSLAVHDLRHSHASLLINNGVELLAISKRLGHTNPTTTLNVYSHLYKSSEMKAIEIINKLEEKN